MKSAQTSTQKTSNVPTQSNTSSDVSTPPWREPELHQSPDYVLDTLRETKHMIKSLQEREIRLKENVQAMYQTGAMAHLVDDENSCRFNGSGVSVTLVQGKAKRKWFPAVQEQIDKLQAEIKKIEATAEYTRAFTESMGTPYWKVTLEQEL